MDMSLTESDDEAEDVDRGNLSEAGKQKRGKVTRNEEVERMVKEILSRHKDFNRDSKESPMERLVEGWNGQMAAAVASVMSTNKKKADGVDPLLEEKVLIDEMWEVRDDGQKVLDWTLRNTIRSVNGDPEVFWKEGT